MALDEAAWRVFDNILALRRYFRDSLHRAERLERAIGEELVNAGSEAEREAAWAKLERLASVSTFFLAGFQITYSGFNDELLVRFAQAPTADERRRMILGG